MQLARSHVEETNDDYTKESLTKAVQGPLTEDYGIDPVTIYWISTLVSLIAKLFIARRNRGPRNKRKR